MQTDNPVKIKAYSKKELVSLYGVTRATFKRWLSKINDLGDYVGQKYTPAQVQKIMDHVGMP